jgi:hypothetical protein
MAMAQTKPSPVEQRIGAQIGALVIQNAALQSRVDQLEAALKTTQSAAAAPKDPNGTPAPAPAPPKH